jgi:Ca2+-binding EF-hand superfamily protein
LRFVPQKEKDFIRSIFHVLDIVRNGELEYEEFISAFKVHFEVTIAASKWTAVMKNMDFESDNKISFTEFLVASSPKKFN